MSDNDLLRDLGKSLAYDRPGAERREAVRSARCSTAITRPCTG